MAEKVILKQRLVGCSTVSYEKAVEAAVQRAAEDHPNIHWFEVVELRGAVAKGKPSEWQATVEVAFKD